MELQAFVSLIRRRWWIVVLAFVVCVGGSAALSASQPKVYKATTRLYVSVPSRNVNEANTGVDLASRLLTSYARIVDTQIITRPVVKQFGNRLTAQDVEDKVSASALPQTVLLDVSATDEDAEFAVELANEAGRAMKSAIDELGANDSGANETGSVVASILDRPEVPEDPISPKPGRDITVGMFLGLALGAAAALAVEALDKTIREADVASEVFGVPVLCSIPRQRRISSDPLVALKSGGSSTGEAYRALRTAIRFRESSQQLKTVLVTSAAASEGKSTIAANLAIAMSLDGARVVLIDADLRRSRLPQLFDLPEGPGLSDVLLGKSTLTEALVPWSRGLSILQVGTYTLNPSEALGSPAMVQVLEEAKRVADIVIVDAPPVLPVADPTVLAALVDGTVVVCRWGRTSLHAADSTRSMLENVGADVIGVVLNAEGGGRSANYYRHYSARPQHRREDRPPPTPLPSPNGTAAAHDEPAVSPPVVEPEPGSPPLPDGG